MNDDKQNGQVCVDQAESDEPSKSDVWRRWSHGAGPLQQQSLGELGFNTSDVPGELFTISPCPKFDHDGPSTYSAWLCLVFEEVCLQLVAHLMLPRSRHGWKREHLSTGRSRYCKDNFLDDKRGSAL